MIPKTYVKSAFLNAKHLKREEFEAFNKVISSWEREYLLLNV